MLNLCGQPVLPVSASECRARIGEITVRLHSDVPAAIEDFAGLYRDAICTSPLGTRAPSATRAADQDSGTDQGIDIQVNARRRGWFHRAYDVAGDGEKLWTAHRVREVLPYIEWGINWRIIARRNDFFQFHAATLAKDGQGLILAADSGAGKSTLTAGLLARGWKYLCDEFALINPQTLHLHPFPKALCIKSGSFSVMERLGLPLWRRRHYVKALKGAVAYIRPADLGPASVAGPVPVRWIIFPQYRAGSPPRLFPATRAQAAFDLATYAFNRRHFGVHSAEMLAQLTRQASCWRLDCGPLEPTCDLLESLRGV